MAAQCRGCLDVYSWRFWPRVDDLPGGANDMPTALWEIARLSSGGIFSLANFLRSSMHVVQSEGIQGLKELGFSSISLIIQSISTKHKTRVRL